MNPFSRNKLTKEKAQFDNTGVGIAVNTVLGLPKATLQVAKDIGQSITRSIASTGLTVAKTMGGASEFSSSDIKSPFGQELWNNFFGTEPVKAIEDRIAEAEISIKASPFARKLGLDKVALPLAFGGVMGSTALDLTPVGGLEKNAIKTLAKETSVEGVIKILSSMKVPEDVAKSFAPHLAETTDTKVIQDIFDNMKGVMGVKGQAEGTIAYKVADKQFPTIKEAVNYKNELDNLNKNNMFDKSKQIDSTIRGVIQETRLPSNTLDQSLPSTGTSPVGVMRTIDVGTSLEAPSSQVARNISPSSSFKSFDTIDNYINTVRKEMQGQESVFKTDIKNLLGVEPETRIKNSDTLRNKIEYELRKGRSPDEIRDVLAGRVTTNNPSNSLDTLRNQFTIDEKRTINFFEQPNDWGYRGVNIAIKMPNGRLAELQIHTPESMKIDSVIRPIYEKWRRVDISKLTESQRVERINDMANARNIADEMMSKTKKNITPLDRFIAEGKIKINREGTRDVYSYKKGNEWQRARDSDSAVKAVTPKEKIIERLPPELEQKAISIAIQKETIENSPLNQLIKYASKTGENKGVLPEVLGGKRNGVGATSKFGRKGDDIVTEVFGRNMDSETARAEFEKFMIRKQQIAQEDIALKQEIKDFKKSQLGTKTTPILEDKATIPPSQVEAMSGGTGELRSLENTAQQQLSKSNLVDTGETFSLPSIIEKTPTSVKAKVNMLDYIRTPDRVLKKIGLEKNAVELRTAYDGYLKELPQNINKITEWSKEVPKESNLRIFKYLDGENVDLNPAEIKVVGEIKSWLAEWADRLKLPKDNRIAEYITHLFDDQLIKKEFDEDLAKIITDKVPSSVYDPFLLKRLGAKGYKQDTWAALDAYVKRGTRKVYMDKPLFNIEEVSKSLEKSQWDYVKKYTDGINMRPTDMDNLFDNGIKQMVGYKLGQRPTTVITQFLRKMTYRGMLGLNFSSALRNISQGINTYAKLGEKYTTIGYSKLLSSANRAELVREGIFAENMIEDRTLSATKKAIEKIDKGLFFFFQQAEKINRGSAYLGAKAKALAEGKTEQQAIEFGKKIVRDTQFLFSKIDTPVVMQSDIVKTLLQFQTFTTKQIEFITEMAKNKEFAGLIRYGVAGLAFVYTIGQAFGMKPQDLIPIYRIGVPPSLKFPYEVGSAIVNAPNKYGQSRDVGQKLSDISKTLTGYIPAGIQGKKTIQGIQAIKSGGSYDKVGRLQFKQGKSTPAKVQSILFGKYASQNAQNYFNRTSGSKSSNPFNR